MKAFSILLATIQNRTAAMGSTFSKTIVCFCLLSLAIPDIKADCTHGNISATGNQLAGCTGIATITGIFNIDANYDLSGSSITELRISGVGAQLLFSGNHTLTLPPTALLSIISSATLTSSGGCNSNKVIRIGSAGATCDGTWSGGGTPSPLFSFTQVQNGKGFNATSLPVELSFFNANIKNESISLTWQTSTELNNARFIIETSTEGEVFNRIGEIAGAGTTTETRDYTFTHHTPSAGINYYRLKQVDFDGTFAYSKVLAINAPGSNDIFAFPNPAKDKITLQYDYSKGTGNVQLYDGLGRKVNASIGGYAGNYEVQLPAGLAKGTYWLKVERGGQVQTVAVVKE